MKRVLALLIPLFIIYTLISSCAAHQEEIVPEYTFIADDSDLGGLAVNWGFSMSRYMNNVENIFGFIPGTTFADQAFDRLKQIQSDYNCSIGVDNNSNSTIIGDRMQASLVSGSHLYDIVTCDTSILRNFSRSGGLTGLSDLIDVKNTEKYGTPKMLELMLWDDDLYGVVPFAWPNLLYSTTYSIIAVNETLVSHLAMPDPREYLDSLTWTWDKFEEVLAAYTFNDSGRTVYGMHCHDADFAVNMLYSNGVSYTMYENGEIKCGIYTEAGRRALARAQDIYDFTCKDYIYPDASTNTGTYLINGDVVMSVLDNVDVIGTTDAIMFHMDNVGILPFPQGPDAVPGQYSSGYSQMAYTTSVPINNADVDGSVAILAAMFEPFEGLETKDDIAEYMADQIFFDKRDAEVFINTVKNANYGYFWEGGRDAVSAAVRSFDAVSSILERYEEQYDKLIEDYLSHHYAGRLAVYGE
ncbi:MAG: extracellular solute-binding protein [Clostridia bacterium]|nr:extracellular solute-binding protein [Clostridia bacterium]